VRSFPRQGREPLELDASNLAITGHLEAEAGILAMELFEVEEVKLQLCKQADREEAELAQDIARFRKTNGISEDPKSKGPGPAKLKAMLESEDWYLEQTIALKDLERDIKFLEQYVVLGLAKSRLLDGLIRRSSSLEGAGSSMPSKGDNDHRALVQGMRDKIKASRERRR
jgi:hypothetical protein